jgi:hypothetical protein
MPTVDGEAENGIATPYAPLLAPLGHPPTFSGRDDDDVDRFLVKADNLFTRLAIPTHLRGFYLGDWLKGEAESWYLTLDRDLLKDYATVCRALRERFQDPRDRLLRKVELAAVVQGEHEPRVRV